jgi:hypothetical protein
MGKSTEQAILKRRGTNGQQLCEEMLTSLAIKEMQIKMTLRFYLTPVRMVIIKTQTTANSGKNVGEKELLYTVGGNVN